MQTFFKDFYGKEFISEEARDDSEKELEKIKNDFSDVTTGNDKLFEENEFLKNKEKDYISKIKELEMKLNQNKEKSDKLEEKNQPL